MQQCSLGLVTVYTKNIWWGRLIGLNSKWANSIGKQLDAAKKQVSFMEAVSGPRGVKCSFGQTTPGF